MVASESTTTALLHYHVWNCSFYDFPVFVVINNLHFSHIVWGATGSYASPLVSCQCFQVLLFQMLLEQMGYRIPRLVSVRTSASAVVGVVALRGDNPIPSE